MAVVKWTEHVRDDLRELFDFIARDSLVQQKPSLSESSVQRNDLKAFRRVAGSPRVP